jgi:3-deoxy-D-manno-octulosonic-acid transferase
MPRPFSLTAYALAARALTPLVPGLLARRAAHGKEEAGRMREKLGHAGLARPAGALVWLHGASVGESLSLLPVVQGLLARRPGLAVLVTSGTVASAQIMAQRLPAGALHQYAPLDAPSAARRFMDHWRPDLAVFVESELWPNLLAQARRSGARLALISARLSEASLRGWRRFPGAARAVLGGFDLVMSQDEACASRLAALGARDDGRLNLKLAGEALPVDASEQQNLQAALADRPLLLAASTHPGEDELVLEAFAQLQTDALLVIAPRHPVRGADVRALSVARGLNTALRSAGEAVTPKVQVLVADTLGELGLWFALARTALVAGSLVPKIGGHNPLEPARQSCPVLTGPHIDNWTSVYAALAAVDGYRTVQDAGELSAALAEALADPAQGRAMADRALGVVQDQGGALDAALDRLIALVGEGAR